MPSSQRWLPRATSSVEHGGGELQVGIAGRDERHERLVAGGAKLGEQFVDRGHGAGVLVRCRRLCLTGVSSRCACSGTMPDLRYPDYFSPRQPGDFRGVFVAAAGEADDDHFVRLALGGQLHRLGHGVRAFQRGQDAFGAGQRVEGLPGPRRRGRRCTSRGRCLSSSCARGRRRDSRARPRSSARRRSGRRRPASRSCSCRAARRAGRRRAARRDRPARPSGRRPRRRPVRPPRASTNG